MKRLGAVVVCMVVMVCGVESSRAQGAAPAAKPAPGPNAKALARAKQLDQQVEKLYGEGKFAEAVQLAEQSLTIKERELGPLHPDVAESLNNLGQLHEQQGTHTAAEPLYVRALSIREKALGPQHQDVAESLNGLALVYESLGAYGRAEPLHRRALAIREKTLGPTHHLVASSLNNLAALHESQGNYGIAERLFLRAIDISEKALGAWHLEVATYINNLANIRRRTGAHTSAKHLYHRALTIREKALPANHYQIAISLASLAILYHKDLSDYAKAESFYLRALNIFESTLGPWHPHVAVVVNNLALLHNELGSYSKAEPLYLRALDVRERALGPLHPDVATSLSNLASMYHDQGAHAKAEPLLLRAIEIREKTLSMVHPDVATSLNNLAALYGDQGAHAKAEPLYLRALDIREKALGTWHSDVALVLSNLAMVYQYQDAHDKAERLLSRALAIHEKSRGPRHPDVAEVLHNLAVAHESRGNHAAAEPLYLRALDILEKTKGTRHRNVAKVLHNLAAMHLNRGAYAKAETLYLRALDIRQIALSDWHPDVAVTSYNLAVLHAAQGASTRAESLFGRAADIRETQLRTELSRLPEPRKRALMQIRRKEAESLVSFHAHDAPARASALELALTTVLRNKGRVLDSLTDNQTALRSSLTPALRQQLDQLTEARAQLTARIYDRKEVADSTNRRKELDALRARIDNLETSLSAASAEFRSQTEPVTIAKVQAALPAGSALVELVHYRRFDAKDHSQRWKEERYLAYVLRPSGPPTWVALGEAAPIDVEVEALQAGMHREPGMAQAEFERRQQQARAALEKLHGLLMAPLASSLQGVSHLLIAPDGKLNLVPFEALIDGNGEYVLQRHLVSYLSSGRDLLRLATKRPASSAATIVAAPDYGPGKSFPALPGALAEGQQLHRSFPQSKLLTGRAASKAALAKLVGPSVLHVATHGFYARGGNGAGSTTAKTLPRDPTRGMFIESFDSALPMPPPPEGDEFDALDRAGLALAGANASADGIITAREIAGLNWSGTQLVVLSACETGLGAVATGEGVYGLRRALVLSGAESQVVSLWNVADTSTLALMKTFYAELARGTGRAEALRRAKLALLQEPRYAHPYYWAPFIPAGDWRPLDGSVFAK